MAFPTLPFIRSELSNPTGEVFYNGFSYAFSVFDRHEQYADLIVWCEERYGVNGPDGNWLIEDATMATVTIWLREAAQALEFKLRWM
ncbi:MAG: hypothetical protein EOP84_08040 [Verrucomicrobiaceae bacterium]|nr:MAG: hypothetical protein EOP84_08040 [Verrucomicrobiaceae bacterium]